MSKATRIAARDNLSPSAKLLLVIACQRGGIVDEGTRAAFHRWISENGEPTHEAVRELARALPQSRGVG